MDNLVGRPLVPFFDEGEGQLEEESTTTSTTSEKKYAAPKFQQMAPKPEDVPFPSWIKSASSPQQKNKNSKSNKLKKKDDAEKTKNSKKTKKKKDITEQPLTDLLGKDKLRELCTQLPKAELLADVSGCVRPQTLMELLKPLLLSGDLTQADLMALQMKKGRDFLQSLIILDKATNSLEATLVVVKETMEDYAKENVRYVELSMTLRPKPSYRSFLQSVLKVMSNSPKGLDARLLVNLDRNLEIDEANSVVSLLIEFVQANVVNSRKLIAGIRLCGVARRNSGAWEKYRETLQRARDFGIPVVVNFAEIKESKSGEDEESRALEQAQVLDFEPDRLVHGAFMTEPSILKVQKSSLPVVVPFTCHFKGYRIPYKSNILRRLIDDAKSPVIVGCDRRALFGSLSQEYFKVCVALELGPRDLVRIVLDSFHNTVSGAVSKKDFHEIETKVATLVGNAVLSAAAAATTTSKGGSN
jgi:adenosine deaminase